MMEGLTILSQHPETVTHSNAVALLVAGAIVFIISIILICIDDDLFFLALIGSILVIAFVAIATTKTVETGKTIYKVTVANTVSLNDFNARYKIISQEGQIYEIVEKDK